MSCPRDWDAASYDRVGAPVHRLGHALLDRLALNGDETVLDAGCGSGAVTAQLLERLPRGRVIAVDGSPAMVAEARRRLDPARAVVRVADLLDLRLDDPADIVFSSATFHWIPDHDRLFARLHDALRHGGRLLAQLGGEGNIAETRMAIARAAADPRFGPRLAGWEGPWHFPSRRESERRLGRAGFEAIDTDTHTVDVTPEDPREYLRTVVLGSHLERLVADVRAAFVDAVLRELPDPPTIRYVRLTLAARRPAAPRIT